MKRKKRLIKGISSIEEQIKMHEEKKKKAREEGNLDLEKYYEGEIAGLGKTLETFEVYRFYYCHREHSLFINTLFFFYKCLRNN